ncbi:DUF3017 domain-containing protein [Streptomyces sp. NPDC058657]|uniref:DUF3017 domain-containing protein n=1 Tax=unclassified Streptomyces TaxID=2593676 RepID=UPI00364BA61E
MSGKADGTKPEAATGAGPDPEAAAGAGPEPDAATGAGPEPDTRAGAEAQVGVEAEAEAQGQIEAEAEAEPGPEAVRNAEAESAAAPEPAAEAQAEPEPVAKGVVSAPGPDGPVRTTRRFPLLTRDTARPEGGGRAAPGDAPAPARQWPLITVLGATGVGLLLVAVDAFDIGFRLGTVLIGVALLTGAALRWVLPSVGMLAVRSRFTDIVTYGALGLTITLLALMTQPNPWLTVPLLEDAVRFTVR